MYKPSSRETEEQWLIVKLELQIQFEILETHNQFALQETTLLAASFVVCL
jgi:uncharacterized membrane protein